MKNKIVRLLLSTALLGSFVVILLIIIRSVESSNDRLQLNEAWTFQADDHIISTPILIDDQIIFRTANKIYSIHAVDGSKNWEITARASDITINVNDIGKPIVGNSNFLISEEQGNSIGIYSTKTGERIWSVEGQSNFINAPIEIVDDVMIVARHDGNLVVYDLTSQQKLWETALPSRSSTPIAANSDWVVVGMEDVLRVYSLKDGRLLNEKMYYESLIGEIALSGSNILVSRAKEGGDWSISSLQLDSLDENWVFHVGETTDPHLSVRNDRLILFNQTLLLMDINNGNVLWKDNSQKYYSAPSFHKNSLFFISVQRMFSNNKEICKIEIEEGTVKDCSLVDRTGRLVTSQSYLLGPLATSNLLIASRGSEIVAFTMP